MDGREEFEQSGQGEFDIVLRPAEASDDSAIWRIVEPIVRDGDTYMLPSDISRDAALAYWLAPAHSVFVAESAGRVVGTFYMRANQRGGGDHVANCGFMTDPGATGRGVARTMVEFALAEAWQRGFRAMQFNCVVSTNHRAIRLWESVGFSTVGRLPGAFRHPRAGFVDALVMYRFLEAPDA